MYLIISSSLYASPAPLLSLRTSTDSFYHRRQLWVEVSRFDALQRKGKLVCVNRWLSEIIFFQVPFNLIGFESAQHLGWGKRIYIKLPLLGYLFCEIFYFIIAHKNRQKFHKPVTLYSYDLIKDLRCYDLLKDRVTYLLKIRYNKFRIHHSPFTY